MKQAAGWTLLALAAFSCLYNISDVVGDLKEWHQAATPAIVGAIVKQIASVGIAAIGGTLLPQPGGTK